MSKITPEKKIRCGRVLDPRTMTYSYSDGSGLVTSEKIIERDLLKAKIGELEAEGDGSFLGRATLAKTKFDYLTYFSK